MKNDGGPAFPRNGNYPKDGMSLRDAFALAVLPTVAALQEDHAFSIEEGSQECYMWADAMIAERSK